MSDTENKDTTVFEYKKFQARLKKQNAPEIDKEIDAMYEMAIRLKKQIGNVVRAYKRNNVKLDEKFKKVIKDYQKLASSLNEFLKDHKPE